MAEHTIRPEATYSLIEEEEGEVAAAIKSLLELGVAKFRVDYHGYGDDGDVDFTILEDTNGVKVLSPEYPAAKKPIEKIADHLLDNKPDWYNNEGGGGVIEIDLTTGEYSMEHYSNRTVSDYTTYRGDLLMGIEEILGSWVD